jgi:hypothetical protein
VAAVLGLACLSLLLTAPVGGDFWWSDAPRHALNGAFVMDLVAAHPFRDPVQWAIDYYLKRPALTVLFYPPMFYAMEALVFAVAGVSHFAAQLTVTLFVALLAASAYRLARLLLPRWPAAGAALLVIGTPETALWGRQVMLDVPAYSLIAASAASLALYLRHGRPAGVYLAAGFLLAAIYTKYNAGFVAPALAATFAAAKGRAVLRDRHALLAGALTAAGLLPAAFLVLRFGVQNLDSVSGFSDTLPLNSLACWLYYPGLLFRQLGIATTVLGTAGLAIAAWHVIRGRDRWANGLLLSWLAIGYLAFSLISVKEPRHSIMALLPLAAAAPICLVTIVPGRYGDWAGLALGAGSLLYTLVYCPVPRVEGYRQIAAFLASNVPSGGTVIYSGFRDANLIFDLAAIRDRTDISVVRADKLLLSVPAGERRRGVAQHDYDEDGVQALLRGSGASYFVVQPGFWSDLAVMHAFDAVINGTDYRKSAHFQLTGDLSTNDGKGGIDIFRPTYPVNDNPAPLGLDMPLAGRRFQQSTPH